MKYDLIIFDADETLFDFKKSERAALENTMRDFNLNYEESFHLEIYKEINSAVWKELEQGLITQSELNILRFQRFLERMEAPCDSLQFADTYKKHLSEASFLYEDSTPLIHALSKNYRLVILSNGLSDVQDNRLRKSAIAGYFEAIIISEEVGLAKPDPGIFQLVLNITGYNDKNRILMVGDNLNSDINGGVNFGIDTCWYNSAHSPNPTGIQPTYEVHNLNELTQLL